MSLGKRMVQAAAGTTAILVMSTGAPADARPPASTVNSALSSQQAGYAAAAGSTSSVSRYQFLLTRVGRTSGRLVAGFVTTSGRSARLWIKCPGYRRGAMHRFDFMQPWYVAVRLPAGKNPICSVYARLASGRKLKVATLPSKRGAVNWSSGRSNIQLRHVRNTTGQAGILNAGYNRRGRHVQYRASSGIVPSSRSTSLRLPLRTTRPVSAYYTWRAGPRRITVFRATLQKSG